MTAEEELREQIGGLLNKVIPDNLFFRPLRKKLDWITSEILSMSSEYVRRKIDENNLRQTSTRGVEVSSDGGG